MTPLEEVYEVLLPLRASAHRLVMKESGGENSFFSPLFFFFGLVLAAHNFVILLK